MSRYWRAVPLPRPPWHALIDRHQYEPGLLHDAMRRLLDGEHGCPMHDFPYYDCGDCIYAEAIYGWTGQT